MSGNPLVPPGKLVFLMPLCFLGLLRIVGGEAKTLIMGCGFSNCSGEFRYVTAAGDNASP